MELNKIILEVLNKHGVTEKLLLDLRYFGKKNTHWEITPQAKLARELEKEVDKYCMTLMEAVACGTPPHNDYE